MRPEASGSTLALPAARGMTFVALCAFAAITWMQMLEPVAGNRAAYAVLAAAAAMLGLLAAGLLRGRLRTAAALAVAVAAFGLALLAGGVDDAYLRPDHWGDLAAAVGRGLSSLPGARVPYRGLDEWTRIVITLGGTVLAVLAAIVAFWPRDRGLGARNVSLVLLMTMYGVPAVALDLGAEFLSGALLAVLVVAYLRLERLNVSDAGAAAMLAVGVTILGLVAAPALDTDEPWFDYETWALSNASAKSTSFSWDHTYGPLDWPRDGRELLRVKARRPAYWKAANLEEFDGTHWLRNRGSDNLDACDALPDRRWMQQISVSVRNLRSQTFVTAGVACAIQGLRLPSIPLGDGTYSMVTRALRRGDAYRAQVYTPLPNERERRDAGDDVPIFLQRFASIELPAADRRSLDPSEALGDVVDFPVWGAGGPPLGHPLAEPGEDPTPAGGLLEQSAYARTWRLAERLRRSADSREDYIEAVLRYLGGDQFTYTEAPPASAENLDGFLFDAKSGYCQQYSGAMALLLRMGGVPARVATGFTTGSLDRKTGEYVVRDLDAHSWVEAWYPGIGWVTFDPTPAAAPARSQPDEDGGGPAGASSLPGAPDLGGDIRSDPSRQVAVAGEGTPWTLIGFGAGAAALLLGLAGWLVRRHRRRLAAGWGPLAELERALVRARRSPGPAATLAKLESAFARTPAAAGYVRALREQRYGAGGVRPAASGRRAVRSELARGGLKARLRAWWALPPRGLH